MILTTYLPIVYANLPFLIGSFRWLWAPLWIISVVILHPVIFKSKAIKSILAYGFIYFLLMTNNIWVNMDEWLYEQLLLEFYYIFIWATILYYYISRKDYKGLAILTKWALICITVTSVTSILVTFKYPLYARLVFSSLKELAPVFTKLGGGGYGFAQSLVIILPFMIFYIKYNDNIRLKKWQLLLVIILFYFCLIRLEFFANLLIALSAIIISLLGVKQIKTSLTILFLLMFLSIIIPRHIYTDIISYFISLINSNSDVYFKLIDLNAFIADGRLLDPTSTIGARTARYPLLWKAFLKSPITGVAALDYHINISEGYHLHWMGKIAATGLFGFFLFLIPQIYYLRDLFKKITSNYKFYAYISIIAFFALGLTKTMGGREIWGAYFILIPGLTCLPYLSSRISQNNKN